MNSDTVHPKSNLLLAPVETEFEDIPRTEDSQNTASNRGENKSNFQEVSKDLSTPKLKPKHKKLRPVTFLWLLFLTLGFGSLVYISIIDPSVLRNQLSLSDAPPIKAGLDKAAAVEKLSSENFSAVKTIEINQAATKSKLKETEASVAALKAAMNDAKANRTSQLDGLVVDVEQLKRETAIHVQESPKADEALKASKSAQETANLNATRIDETASSFIKPLDDARKALQSIEERMVIIESQQDTADSTKTAQKILDRSNPSITGEVEISNSALEKENVKTAELGPQSGSSILQPTIRALLALNDLRRTAETGQPFNSALERAQKALPDAEVLRTGSWIIFASSGLPNASQLKDGMAEVAQKIRRSRQKTAKTPNESWISWFVSKVVYRLKIRQVSPTTLGNGPAAVASRAEAALQKGNVVKAVQEVSILNGIDASYFSEWLIKAQANHSAIQDIRGLEKAIMTAVGET